MYTDKLKIDPLSLDKEWLDQPGLFMYWAEKSAEARAEVETARYKLDQTTALVGFDIRTNPDKYGIAKPTESAINSLVILDKEVEKQTLALIKLRKTSEDLSRMVNALEQRRKALENLCFLTNQGYFSQPEENAVVKKTERKRRGVRKSKSND